MGLAKEDCGELMDRTVASSMIVPRPGAEVKGAAGRESTGLVRTSGLAGPSNRDGNLRSSRTACGDTSRRG